MNKGKKLYNRAKKVIPGGTMLLSKRPEMYLPENWPSYYSKAKGCTVWDLDGHGYTDMYIMGIGTNTLGYGYDIVDKAVSSVVREGNMSTFNCPEEVLLAERLVEIHPWSDMVRFARSGGEANAIAIRIARAASGKDKVAVCGYHGWHDWYLSSNLASNSELDGHLLPGLDPVGVPKSLQGSTITFEYNNFEQIKEIVSNNPDLGVIKMEVLRSEPPKQGYLELIRNLCDSNNIVLIFDECTSGFRETFGGIHKKYSVEPDMCMFGKALGNGYAITAVVGRRNVMEYAQKTFISSTFWTERIGPTAALSTLKVMEELESWKIITEQGKKIQSYWRNIAASNNIPILIGGIPALSSFTISSDQWLKYKTFITQEMLKYDFLAGHSVYVCIEHTDSIINEYIDRLNSIFYIISRYETEKKDIQELLEGPICHNGFKRLN